MNSSPGLQKNIKFQQFSGIPKNLGACIPQNVSGSQAFNSSKLFCKSYLKSLLYLSVLPVELKDQNQLLHSMFLIITHNGRLH